jgi:DNA-binding transcriptional regulator GbsR (MarR family)
MRTLYGFNRPMKVKEIMSDTGFTQKQVWKTLEFLSSVRMITKAYEDTGAKRRIPPKRNLIVSLSETQFKRAKRFLKK